MCIVSDIFLLVLPFYNRLPQLSNKTAQPSIPAKYKHFSEAQHPKLSLPVPFLFVFDILKVLDVASQIRNLKENRSGWKSVCGPWRGGKKLSWSGRSWKFLEMPEKSKVRYTIPYQSEIIVYSKILISLVILIDVASLQKW